MRRSLPALLVIATALIAVALLAYPPRASAPPQTFAPTVSEITGPADGLTCTLLTDAGMQPALPTAAYGRINRVRQQYGVTDCGAEADGAQAVAQQRSRPGDLSMAASRANLANR